MTRTRGAFIVLEGADGCGKSTQALRLVESLRDDGAEPLHVRDPGSTRLAERVRAILLDPDAGSVCPAAETFLYMAARAQLADEVVAPALAAGRIVVCERWTLSTEVYQGLAGGVGADEVRRIAGLAERGAAPDVVIVLDVEAADGLARLDGEPDRMEAKGLAFHAQVAAGYRRLAAERERCVVVPAADVDRVAEQVLAEVRRALAA